MPFPPPTRPVMPLIAISELTPVPTDSDTAAQEYWDNSKSVFNDALLALYMLRKEDAATGISKYQFSFDTGAATYSDDFKAVYLPFPSYVTVYQAGEVLPNSVTADSLTLHISPWEIVRPVWAAFMPADVPPLTDIYYSHIDETTVWDYLWTAVESEYIDAMFPSPFFDHVISTFSSMYPNASDDRDVVFSALMDHNLEYIPLLWSWQIAEMTPDAANPTRQRLDVMFTCGEPHSDENTCTFFQYFQRMPISTTPQAGEVIINYHLTGHPMIMSMLAEAQIDTTSLSDTQIETQTQSRAMLLLEAARIDVMDRTVLPKDNRTKFDTNTIFLDPDSAPPTIRVQAQISSTAQVNVEAIFPQQYVPGNGAGGNTNFEDVLTPLDTLGMDAEVYGQSLVYIYNPDGIDLYFKPLNDAGAPTNEYSISYTVVNDVVRLAVASLLETESEGIIEVHSGSLSGPLLFTLRVLILEFRALPVRFFQARNMVGGVEQQAGNMANEVLFFDKLNFLLGKQANIFIIPAVADPAADPLHKVLDIETSQPLPVPLTLYEVKADPGDPDVMNPPICAMADDLDFTPLSNGTTAVQINSLVVWSFDSDPNDKKEGLGVELSSGWWNRCTPSHPLFSTPRSVTMVESIDGLGLDTVPFLGAHELVHAMEGVWMASGHADRKYVNHTPEEAKGLDCYQVNNLMYPSMEFGGSAQNVRLTARQARILNNLLAADYSWD